MLIVGLTGLTFLALVSSIYGLYFLKILRKSQFLAFDTCQVLPEENLPSVSIIVSTFNEENVIERKINNLSSLNYPINLMEIIVFDDASKDKTVQIATQTIKNNNVNGRVIVNPNRIGLNRSLNKAIAEATHNIICVTDSDVLLEENSLRIAVDVLSNNKTAGGVTGHVEPVFQGTGLTQQSEISYRSFYHVSMLAESSIHSAFPGNGPLIVFDKSKVPGMIPNDYGSTDGNIAMNIIRQGLRFLYVPNSIVYEPSAESLQDQRIQKIRRAKRLIQVFLKNKDIAFNKNYGSFGRLIFPLKLLMLALCPTLMLVGISLLGISIVLSQNLLLYLVSGIFAVTVLAAAVISKPLTSLLSSFLFHQIYLVIGLFSSFKKSVYWKTIDRKTALSLAKGGT